MTPGPVCFTAGVSPWRQLSRDRGCWVARPLTVGAGPERAARRPTGSGVGVRVGVVGRAEYGISG